MDGTLVDSEPLHEETLIASLRSQGIDPAGDLHEMVVGLSTLHIYEIFQSRYGLTLPFVEWCRMRYQHYMREAPMLKPRTGALELFRELQWRQCPQAIVSNSDRLIVDANLRAIGIAEPELVTVCRNDVRLGKPHPECYQRALWLLNEKRSNAVVLEDSHTGVQAGLAAGISTLYWPQRSGAAMVEHATLAQSPEDVRQFLGLK
jgi:HAD superfamily hydrolase (TIGR01509 family)